MTFVTHRQCLSRDLVFRYEQVDLVDADTLPAPDDYESHAAILMTTLTAATFNTFRFLPHGSRKVEALGRASPVDVDGLRIPAALGQLQAQMAAHPSLALEIGTDFRVHNAPLNRTMKQVLMKTFRVTPHPQNRNQPVTTAFTPSCLQRTRVLVIFTGLREENPQARAVLHALRGLSNVVVEDVADASVQLWFVLHAASRISEVKARAVDISDTLRDFEALAAALGWNAEAPGEGEVGFAILQSPKRGRFRLPLAGLRVHRWRYKYMKGPLLREKVRRVSKDLSALQSRSQPAPPAAGVALDDAMQRAAGRAPCQWQAPGTQLQLNGAWWTEGGDGGERGRGRGGGLWPWEGALRCFAVVHSAATLPGARPQGATRAFLLFPLCFLLSKAEGPTCSCFTPASWLLPRFPLGTAHLSRLDLRWVQSHVTKPEGTEALLAPLAGSQVTLRCRDPLSGGHALASHRVGPGQLLFLPSGLSCLGSVRGTRALAVLLQGARARPRAEKDTSPQTPRLDGPLVVDVGPASSQPGEGILGHATHHFRLLHVHTTTLAAGEAFPPTDAEGDVVQVLLEVREGRRRGGRCHGSKATSHS